MLYLRSTTRASRALAALLVTLVALLTRPPVVEAEASPIRVILSHIPIMTTWGPPNTTGVVMLVLEEGDVRADLVGLPALGDDQRYELWLVQSDSGQTYSLGRFAIPAETPVTHVDFLLAEPVPDRGWDMVMVTVEPEPDAEPASPDPRRVLVGAFPGTPAELRLLPPALPQTGGARVEHAPQWAGLAAANAILLVGLHGWRRSRATGRVR